MSHDSTDRPDSVLQPEHITADFLYDLFKQAYLDVHRDDVGDIYIKDTYVLWVFPQAGGDQIRLMVQLRGNPEAPRSDKLTYVNDVNDGMRLVRAYVDADNDIGFDYYMSVLGGITKPNIILSLRHFIDYVRAAVQRDEQGVFK